MSRTMPSISNLMVLDLLFNTYKVKLEQLINHIAKKQEQLTGSSSWTYKGRTYSYGGSNYFYKENPYKLLHKSNYNEMDTYLRLHNDYLSKQAIIHNYLYNNKDKEHNFYKILPKCVHHLLYDHIPVSNDMTPVRLKGYEIVEEILQELMLQELIT